MLQQTLSILVPILSDDVELPGLIETCHYVNLLEIMKEYCSGVWNSDRISVVFAIIRIFGQVVCDC